MITILVIYKDNIDLNILSKTAMEVTPKYHTAVIDVVGEIAYDEDAEPENVIKALQAAFEAKTCKGIILRVNSPGGTPVQARQIYNEIKRLRAFKADIPVYAVIEDLGTSGAYLVASAAEKIYADETSLVGSIGVISGSFGFVDAMNKIGVERRLYIAGDHKAMLDPFSPRSPQDEEFFKSQLNIVHQQFIDNVKSGRGNKLHETPELYSGRFWTGIQAKELGLIDEFGDVYKVSREVFQAPKLVDYTQNDNMFDRLTKKFGVTVTQAFERLFVRMR